jgi:hypothetical protein
MRNCHHLLSRSTLLAFALLLVPAGLVRTAPAEAIGKVSSGLLLAREAPGKPLQTVKPGDDVFNGLTYVGLPGSAITSKNGVQLSFLSDLERQAKHPVLEAAVKLFVGTEADLALTLDRGRIELTNKKAKGSAKVRVLVHKAEWELTLNEPGSKIGMEVYGRWPRGVFFEKDAKTPNEPTAELVLIALKGSVDLKVGGKQVALSAPPGPAIYHWDSVAGAEAGPGRLDKLPEWADPDAKPSPDAKERAARLAKLQKDLAGKAPDAVIADWLKSKDAGERRLAVVALGATDNLAGLYDALSSTDHADVRSDAVLTLRHWIGRKPGQDLALDNFLLKEKKYSAGQARIVLRLLHSFGEEDIGRPETYEALIAYLAHDKLAIRELASWQLYRLVAGGKDIPYNAAGSPKELEAAAEKWKKLIPEGKLPPRG